MAASWGVWAFNFDVSFCICVIFGGFDDVFHFAFCLIQENKKKFVDPYNLAQEKKCIN